MESISTIDYEVLYHDKGYISLQVPSLKKLRLLFLFRDFKKTLPFPLPAAIKDFSINPLNGNLVIVYNPDEIDILEFIDEMANNPNLQKIFKG